MKNNNRNVTAFLCIRNWKEGCISLDEDNLGLITKRRKGEMRDRIYELTMSKLILGLIFEFYWNAKPNTALLSITSDTLLLFSKKKQQEEKKNIML